MFRQRIGRKLFRAAAEGNTKKIEKLNTADYTDRVRQSFAKTRSLNSLRTEWIHGADKSSGVLST
jgi:hypothetical protein